MIRRGFLSAALALAAAGAAARAGARQTLAARTWIPSGELLASLESMMQLAGVPGMSIAVLDRGKLAWQRCFGVADASSSAELRDHTLMEAASTSKPVFAYAVLQLVTRGDLDPERPLAAYHRPPYLPADARLDRITTRHVLTHTSGLRNWAEEGSPGTFLPLFEPGSRFQYSGEAFFWLQLVVENLTGKGLDALMRELLFEPAGMTRSCFALDADAVRDLAYGHVGGRRAPQQGMRDVIDLITPLARAWRKPLRDWSHQDWLRSAAALDPQRPTQRVRFQNAASSLFTTAGDYARFLGLLMDSAPAAPWRIRENLRREMLSPLVAVRAGSALWRGLGWSIERCDGALRFGHEGNNDGRFTAYAGAEAASGRGVVILANDGAGFGLYQRLVRATTGCDQLSFL